MCVCVCVCVRDGGGGGGFAQHRWLSLLTSNNMIISTNQQREFPEKTTGFFLRNVSQVLHVQGYPQEYFNGAKPRPKPQDMSKSTFQTLAFWWPADNQIGGQFIRNIFKCNDTAGNFNDAAEHLMIEHSNLTMDQLHHKIPYGDRFLMQV